MTNYEAVENLRHLGRLVAYEVLKLKGTFPYIDESVDIVVRIMYEDFIKKYNA